MPVITGVYLKDFPALPSSVADANIIPIAITGDQVAYRTTVAGIVTDARITSKLLTGLSVTGSTILATDTILQAFGKVQNQLNGKVSSVGLTMPAAFNVANSPITSAGTLAVTAAGVASQYIRGDGALADFPTTGGGGSSVSYYLNGSVSQGTFVGNTYYEMNKTPVIGTGTDFTINANGYIAQFITDANDPASLLIPAGNWNVEMYFSASSSGGTPSFYVEVYKYDGSTFTLLGTSSATPEGITNGTAIDIYYTSVGIPETVLTLTDRLAIRVYVTHSGRTITLHTEDNHLSEIVTTFSNGLTTLNGLTKQAQYFATGTTGTDFAIVSSVDTHTFNLPTASASNRGALSSADWSTFNGKQGTITLTTTGTSGAATFVANTLNIPNYADGGVLSLSAIGATPNANAATITGTVLNLEPASASFGGVVTTGTQTFAGDKTIEARLTVDYGATTASSIQATSTNANGRALTVLANSTLEPFYVTQQGSGKLATFTRIVGGSPDERVTILNDGSIYTGGKVAIGTISAGSGGVDSVVVRNSSDTELKIVGTTGTGSAVFSASPTFTGVPIFGSSISNGTYTYTLPSATGTLALTSALSSYLPLSGGTLTGALSGTSATYNSILTLNKTDAFAALLIQPSTNTTAAGTRFLNAGNDMYFFIDNSAGDYGPTGGNGPSFAYNANIRVVGNRALQIATNDTVRMTISNGGNVGIGVTAPTGQLSLKNQISNGSTPVASYAATNGVDGQNFLNGYYAGDSDGYGSYPRYLDIVSVGSPDGSNGGSNIRLFTNPIANSSPAVERMRITSGGDVLIGTTSTRSTMINIVNASAKSSITCQVATNGDNAINWINASSTYICSIVVNASSVSYNTSSDYRLKQDFKDFSGLNLVSNIKVYDYEWKIDNTRAYGVVAHELEQIIPQAVSGLKDDILENGEIKSQGVDYSKLVPIMIKAIQELKAEIDLLKGKPIIPTDNNLE